MKKNYILILSCTVILSALFAGYSFCSGHDSSPLKDNRLVGKYADPERIVFIGLKNYGNDELLDALMLDSDFQEVCEPKAAMSDYLNTIRRKILTGYKHNGFPAAKMGAALTCCF